MAKQIHTDTIVVITGSGNREEGSDGPALYNIEPIICQTPFLYPAGNRECVSIVRPRRANSTICSSVNACCSLLLRRNCLFYGTTARHGING